MTKHHRRNRTRSLENLEVCNYDNEVKILNNVYQELFPNAVLQMQESLKVNNTKFKLFFSISSIKQTHMTSIKKVFYF